MGRSKGVVKKKIVYIRKGTYPIEEVYNAVKDVLFEEKKVFVNVDGDMVKGNSQRYQTFFTNGVKCACCGIEGKYFAKERNPNVKRFHLNLYAIDEDGNEIMMTKDHIIPVSKGGKDILENYQTMCMKCNIAKGNKTV